MQRFIFETEAARAGAPLLAPYGLKYLGPVLMKFGTDSQRQRFLPRILSAEDYWCQGYSEPNAGSDLAGLQCVARPEGDHYVIQGTKLWTSHAHAANWIFCLVRTDAQVRPQAGISFILVDLRSPGITITPIVSFAGEHEVNQVFFDSVRVPVHQLVGAEGEGWKIARYLLELERGSFIMSGLLARKLARCKALTAVVPSAEHRRALAAQAALVQIDLLALEAAELHCAQELGAGRTPGPEAPLMKIEFSEIIQRIESLTLAALGGAALAYGEHDERSERSAIAGCYMNDRATTIYGGSNEIQRELIARQVLGG